MNKKTKKRLIGFGVAVTLFGGVAPVVPSDMQLVASYQGPYIAQFGQEEYYEALSSSTAPILKTREKKLDRPVFEDENGDGIVSWSLFADSEGNHVYVQIPDAKYQDMGKKDGKLHNPTKTEYQTVFDGLFKPTKANAAIAFDATAGASDNSGAVTSITYAHTCTGADLTLAVFVTITDGVGHGITISSATYNGVTMTAQDTANAGTAADLTAKGYLLIAPATGANNVVVTISGVLTSNKQFGVTSQSYTGTSQAAQPDSKNKNQLNDSTANPFTVTTTVVGTNTWLAGAATEYAGDIAGGSPGSGTTYRGVARFNMFGADSNGTVAAGSRSLNWGRAGSTSGLAGVIVSISEAVSAAPPPQPTQVIFFQ